MLALVDGIGNKRMKYSIVMLVSVAVLLIMAANGSRTGILAIGAVMLLYLFRNMDNARRRWIASLLFSLPVIAAVVYLSFLKRASNSGRGLILGVCWNMFRDAPLLGHVLLSVPLSAYDLDYVLLTAAGIQGCAAKYGQKA